MQECISRVRITAERESQVDTQMEQVSRLAQEHGNDLAFVVNHSGGKDSTRMMGLVRQMFPDSPTYAVMAYTGFEHQSPVSAVD